MERPDLQRMLRAIERKQINLVITKDLSRLGRNYLQTGHLIEDFFPRNGVRYIAMNDGIDTLRDNNDIAPFKNILNEMYSKDISKKVHSSYLLKAQKGQFTGCLAPFGYRKDPEDKNHLLIDEETAPIVRLIFGYALKMCIRDRYPSTLIILPDLSLCPCGVPKGVPVCLLLL